MTEFQWKDNFINQEKKIEHINKFVLLILMIKVKVGKTTKLERTIPSLRVQDFSVYEEYLKKYILPAKIKNKSKLLHNQPLFKDYVGKIKNDEALKINVKVKQIIFEKFAKYVNLKDIKNKKEARNLLYWSCIPLLVNFIFLIFLISDQKNWGYVFISLMALVFLFLWGMNILWAFQDKSKVFLFNTLRIDTELCLLALQKELEELEKILGRPSDPYKKNTEKQNFESFQNIFPVQDTFITEMREKGILDENSFVNKKYNHFLIQYLKKIRKKEFQQEGFDWQLINHVMIFDISKYRKSCFLKENFKRNTIWDKEYQEFYKNMPPLKNK